jgi:hypothetical protein
LPHSSLSSYDRAFVDDSSGISRYAFDYPQNIDLSAMVEHAAINHATHGCTGTFLDNQVTGDHPVKVEVLP